MGCDWRMGHNLNTRGVFWMNQVQMVQCRSNVASERKVAGTIRFLLVNVRVCSLSVEEFCMRH